MSTLSNAIQISIYGYPVGGAGTVFEMALTNSLTAGIGTLSAFTTEVSDNEMTVTDFEGLVKDTVGDEARFVGARRVENGYLPLANWSTSAVYQVATYDADIDTMTIEVVDTSVGTISHLGSNTGLGIFVAGEEVRAAYDIRIAPDSNGDVPTEVNIHDGAFLAPTIVNIKSQLTTDWQRFTPDIGTIDIADAFDKVGLSMRANLAGSIGFKLQFRRVQLETIQGQANQNPSEYVSVGVGTEADVCVNGSFTETPSDSQNTLGWAMTFGALDNGYLEPDGGNLLLATTTTDFAPIPERLYSVTYTRRGTSSDTISPTWGGIILGSVSTAGTHTEIIRANTNAGFTITAFGIAGTLELDDFIIKEIDHGSNVDGVKYFDYENGNTVASNVVTEVTGTAIADATLKGVLIEEESTNLTTYSEAIGGTDWIDASVIATLNDAVAPDGTTTATKVVWAATEQVFQSSGVLSGTGVAVSPSFYVKRTSTTGTFDLANPRASGTGEWIIDCANLPDEWVRITRGNIEDYGSVVSEFITHTDSQSGLNFRGNGAAVTVHLWGAQLEKLPYPTSYMPTEGSTVTRSVTTLEYESPTFLQTTIEAYTIVVDLKALFDTVDLILAQNWGLFIYEDGNNKFGIFMNGAGKLSCLHKANGVGATAIIASTVFEQGDSSRAVLRYDGTNIAMFIDGVKLASTPVAGDVIGSGSTRIVVGSSEAGLGHSNQPIGGIEIYSKALSDAKCVELTS